MCGQHLHQCWFDVHHTISLLRFDCDLLPIPHTAPDKNSTAAEVYVFVMDPERFTTSHSRTGQCCEQDLPLSDDSIDDLAHLIWAEATLLLDWNLGQRQLPFAPHSFTNDLLEHSD